MIIKNRHFNVEKMGDFLAQQSGPSVLPVKYPYSPSPAMKSKKFDSNLFESPELNAKKYHLIRPSDKAVNVNMSVKNSPKKGSLPPIEELPPIRSYEKGSRASKLVASSKSTPKLRNIDVSLNAYSSKKLELLNQKCAELLPTEESNKKKMIDYSQIKTFNDKYNIQFQEGYQKNLLIRCVELLNTENDPFILENIVPNKYREYITNYEANKKSYLPSISEIHKKGSNVSNLLASFPPILTGIINDEVKPKGLNGMNKLRDYSSERGDVSSVNGHENSTISSTLSLNYRNSLPKLDLESFEKSLNLFQETANEGLFYIIKANNKGVSSEFGFCEVVFNEKNRNSACITKYFVARAYRKMKMVLPITLRLVEHLFKNLNLEKVSIRILGDNTFAQNDLRILGFKLEKIEFEEGNKMKVYSIRKASFKDLLDNLPKQETA